MADSLLERAQETRRRLDALRKEKEIQEVGRGGRHSTLCHHPMRASAWGGLPGFTKFLLVVTGGLSGCTMTVDGHAALHATAYTRDQRPFSTASPKDRHQQEASGGAMPRVHDHGQS